MHCGFLQQFVSEPHRLPTDQRIVWTRRWSAHKHLCDRSRTKRSPLLSGMSKWLYWQRTRLLAKVFFLKSFFIIVKSNLDLSTHIVVPLDIEILVRCAWSCLPYMAKAAAARFSPHPAVTTVRRITRTMGALVAIWAAWCPRAATEEVSEFHWAAPQASNTTAASVTHRAATASRDLVLFVTQSKFIHFQKFH